MLFYEAGGSCWINERLVAADDAVNQYGEGTNTKRGMEKFAASISVKLGDNGGGHGELRPRQVGEVSK